MDYVFNWAKWLGTDTIESVVITIDGDETLLQRDDSPIIDEQKVTVWLVGGTENERAIVSCQVTTVEKRKETRSVIFEIQPR